MQNSNKFTVLSMLEANRTDRTITRTKPARWFYRRNTALANRLLAGAVQSSIDSTGACRKKRMHASL